MPDSDSRFPASQDPLYKLWLQKPPHGVLRAFIVNRTTVRCGKLTIRHREPIYTLARRLVGLGVQGTTFLQTYTAQGTPSLRGRIGRMARQTIWEDRSGLRIADYRPGARATR